MAMRANPGKFNTALDEAVWSLSLEGYHAGEIGSSTESPGIWACFMQEGDEIAQALERDRSQYPHVTDTELEFLRESGAAGVILMEDSSGSVSVKYYDDPAALNADWKEAEEELSVEDDEDYESNGREGNVDTLARMSLTKLRRHQALNAKQIEEASRTRNTSALEELQRREREIDQAIMQREFGQTPNGMRQNPTHLYRIRYVHKISPKDSDVKDAVPIPDSAFADSKKLGRALRDAGALAAGARVREFRVEGDKVIVFPVLPGITTYWHSLIIEPSDQEHSPNPKLNLDRNRIQKALAYVHHWESPARGKERQSTREAANYAARMQGLNEEERRVLFSALHIEASQRPPSHKKNTSIADRRKAGVIEGLTKAEMDSMEIQIPTFDWKQIGGDVDPGTYGGMIARADGDQIELIEIQPVRELVGDGEAKDVGFPFWSKEGTYDLSDLSLSDEGVQSAIEFSGLGEHLLDMTPEQRAVAIAEACMQAGHRSEESSSGWAKDVLGGRIVDWMSGTRGGYEYIADEDDEFRREILGERYGVVVDGSDVDYAEDEDDAIDAAKKSLEHSPAKHVQVKDMFDGEIVWDSNDAEEEHEPNRRARGHRRNAGGEGSSHYRTISEIKEANNAAGLFFFKKDTIKFWRSKIEPRVYGGRYFITSEQMGDDQPRLFSVREAHPSGRVTTAASGLRGKGAAEDAIDTLLGQHTPNTPRPVLEREGTLDQLLEMQAETLEPDGRGRVPREVKNALQVTEGLRKAVSEYEVALEAALDEVVRQYPPNDGASAYDLFSDKAPYLVLMTLRGEGVGIWDGDWDAHYDSDQIKKVQALLEHKLGRYADSSGSGLITNALDDAVFEAMRDAGYEFDEHTYVKVSDDDEDDEMEKNQRGHRRWHIFLNGELLEPVYMDPSYTADEVKRYLVKAGYSPTITVDQPPERRTGLPPHYRAGTMSQNRRSRR